MRFTALYLEIYQLVDLNLKSFNTHLLDYLLNNRNQDHLKINFVISPINFVNDIFFGI